MHCSKVPGQGSKWELDPAHSSHARAWSWVCLEEGMLFIHTKEPLLAKPCFYRRDFSNSSTQKYFKSKQWEPCKPSNINQRSISFPLSFLHFPYVSNIHRLILPVLTRESPALTQSSFFLPSGRLIPWLLTRITLYWVNLGPVSIAKPITVAGGWNTLVG